MKNYTNLDEIYYDAGTHQITAQELLNRRTHVCGQWQEIALSPELRDAVIEKITLSCGGRGETPRRVRSALTYGHPQHWALSRFILEKYGDRPAFLSYCAGQDMTYEMKELRNHLKK